MKIEVKPENVTEIIEKVSEIKTSDIELEKLENVPLVSKNENTKQKKECPACKKIFKGEKAYAKHISKCSKEILCQHCGKVCKSEKKHQEHEQECFDKLQGPLQCKTCKQMFSTTKNLRLLENPRLSIINYSVFFGVPVFFFIYSVTYLTSDLIY